MFYTGTMLATKLMQLGHLSEADHAMCDFLARNGLAMSLWCNCSYVMNAIHLCDQLDTFPSSSESSISGISA